MSIPGKDVVIIILVIVVGVLLLILLVRKPELSPAQARQDARSADALAETAKQAVQTVLDRTNTEKSFDEIVLEAKREIKNAPDDRVAHLAALNAICSMPDYRNDPSC